jgi:hypothetical protein
MHGKHGEQSTFAVHVRVLSFADVPTVTLQRRAKSCCVLDVIWRAL